jgi:plastocyanin
MDPVRTRFSRRLVLKTGVTAAGLAAAGMVGSLTPPVVAAAGEKTFSLLSGSSSRDHALDLNSYFPKEVFVNAGDTIVWKFPSMEPHTVTFPVPLNGPWPDPFSLPPTGIGGAVFDNTTTVSSGLIAGGATYALTFDAEGTFTYVCLLHSSPVNTVMRGIVHVLPAGSARPFSQAEYDRQARLQISAGLKVGNQLQLAARRYAMQRGPAGQRIVVAGHDNGDVMWSRFSPQWVNVRKGQTIRFVNLGSDAPHTVTFGAEPPGPFPINLVPPSHGPGGDPADYQGGDLNSGFLWAQNPPGFGGPFPTHFDVTFTKAGRFHYICGLHDEMGMVGVVTVTP